MTSPKDERSELVERLTVFLAKERHLAELEVANISYDEELMIAAAIAALEPQAGMVSEREESLQHIADNIEYWLTFVTGERNKENLLTGADTHVMLPGNAPPYWPTVGQLKRWLEVLRTPSEQGSGLREALEPEKVQLEARRLAIELSRGMSQGLPPKALIELLWGVPECSQAFALRARAVRDRSGKWILMED